MEKIELKFKEDFDKIELSLKEEKDLKNRVIKQYVTYKKRRKDVLLILTILLIGIISFGITYAKEIKETVKGFTLVNGKNSSGHSMTSGESSFRKEMNYFANLDETDGYTDKKRQYSINELEEILDFQILHSIYFEKDIFTQEKTEKIDGKISRALFTIKGFNQAVNKKENVSDNYDLFMSFATKYASEDVHFSWGTGSSMKVTEYYLKKLDTLAYITTSKSEYDWHNENNFAFLTYDNVYYYFHFNQINKTKSEELQIIKDVLDSLEYRKEK